MQEELKGLQALLAQTSHDELLQRWMAATRRRCRPTETAGGGFTDLEQRCRGLVDTLAIAVDGATWLGAGSPELREPIQQLSFIAGWMAGVGLPIGVGVALGQGLAEVLGLAASSTGDVFVLVIAEAYVIGARDRAADEHRRIIEQSQVVCALREDAVALFLVGDPRREAIDDAVGRLLMLALMRDARHVLIDTTGLVTVEPSLTETLSRLRAHQAGLRAREVVLTGPIPEDARHALGELRVTCREDVRAALEAMPVVDEPSAAGERDRG